MPRIIHLSDTHILASEDSDLSGLYPFRTLKPIVQKIAELKPRADVILLTGDVGDKGTEEEYALFKKLLTPLGMPVYWIPGNHDNAAELQKASDGRLFLNNRTVRLDAWNVILLNSQVIDKDYGHISNEEFDYLSAQLNQYPDNPTLVTLHHTPCSPCVNPGCQLNNHDEFLSFLKSHPQVKLVLAGHTHHADEIKTGNLTVFTAPSTLAQVLHPHDESLLDINNFMACHTVDGSTIGFGVFDLSSDGSYTQQLHHIAVNSK